jgi:hypothetical protein
LQVKEVAFSRRGSKRLRTPVEIAPVTLIFML